ncbi:hippocampus abundant transcript-like protein 1 [Diabrotica virgifera virgifera]|uniref:Major facilitator superfamily (MFS) profile domain-containing protein n=1 Tax=Diabrotica virgifera virgifera TaxID=50390 RepID=A0ABM5KWE2_DIAVI|nr:hippocampus abundant transcript-like protein 1 [Diabrotica virgifera virgifera]
MFKIMKYPKIAWLRKITVEVPLFLTYTSFLLLGSILNNFTIYRTCYNLLKYDEADCALLGRVSNNLTRELEKNVQPLANIVTMVLEMPTATVPVIICIFAGPWSDKHGRIPVQLMSLIGFTVSMSIFGIMAAFRNLSPWYFVLAAIPSMLTGGAPTYFAVILAYINDISTDHTRALRMAIFEAVLLVALLLGSLSSGPILYSTNYETVFFLAAGLLALASLYTMFLLPETAKIKEGEEGTLKELIRCSYFIDMFKAVFKKREHHDRCIVVSIVVTITIMNFITNGENVIKFPFLREKLGWTLNKNNYFNAASHVITIVGTVGATLVLHRKLHMKETVVSLMGILGFVLNSFLRGAATSDAYIYVGAVVSIFAGAAMPLLRTRIAQIVPAEEMGKIFALIVGLGGVAGLSAAYMYTTFYNATINIHSGAFNYFSAILYLFAIFLVGIIICFELCSPKKKHNLALPESMSKDKQESNGVYIVPT